MQHAHISMARYVSSKASGMKFGQIARPDQTNSDCSHSPKTARGQVRAPRSR